MEFRGDSIEFNSWMNERLEEMKKEYEKTQHPQDERSTVSEEV